MSDTTLDPKQIFLEALDKESPEELLRFLDQACGKNAEVRSRVETLLSAHREVGNFLGGPPSSDSRTIAHTITEKSGTEIGPYKLLQQIGEGGMGVVYMAEQREPVSRRVALKIIKPGMDTRQVIARFEAERQALAMMDHPNIAKVFDAGTTDTGRPYFVMELVKGVPITEYCDEHQLSPRERLELFSSACQAVQHAHQKGIIHRDIKPSNVMVAQYDDRPVPKIIDFGVAKAIEQRLTEKTVFTEFGQVVGTMEYMSPEQAKLNQQDVDTRSDIYSLGVLLYELLTGETPFDGERLRSAAFDELLRIIREEDPPRPSQKLSTSQSLPSIAANRHVEPKQLSTLVHGELDWIVMKALEKDRTRRYETANKFAEDVQRYLTNEAVLACPPSIAYRFRKFASKNKPVIATATAITAALMIGITIATWQAVQALRDRDRAVAAEITADNEAKKAIHGAERAKTAESIAKKQAERAEYEHRQARREQYFAEMTACQLDLSNQNLGKVYSRLVGYLPLDAEEDHRDWEWYYLLSRCRRETRTLFSPGFEPCAAWSPDDQFIGSGGAIWRIDSGKQIRLFNTSRIARHRVAWSYDSNKFAWCMTDDENAFYVWDRLTDNISRFVGHQRGVRAVAWSPNASQIASCSNDLTIKIWDVKTNEILWTTTVTALPVDITWSPDGEMLAASSYGNFQVWDMATKESVSVKNYSGRGDRHCVAWHPDSHLLAVGDSQSWYLVDRTDWSQQQQQPLQRGGQAIAFSPDGQYLAVSDGEGATVWESNGEHKVAEIKGHLAGVVSVSWAPDSRRLVTADSRRDIKLWELRHLEDPLPIETDTIIDSMEWLEDNQTLATTSQNDAAKNWWNTHDGSLERQQMPIIKDPLIRSRDRRWAALHREDQHQLEILSTENQGLETSIPIADQHTLLSASFSPNAKRIVVQSFKEKEYSIEFWDIGSRKALGTWTGIGMWGKDQPAAWQYCRWFTWEHAGSYVAAIGRGDAGDDGKIRSSENLHVFDATKGQRILKWCPEGRGAINCLAWNRDGRYIALGTRGGHIEILDIEARSKIFSGKLYQHSITSLTWHPKGKRLAFGTGDGFVNIASSYDGRILLSLPIASGNANKLAWSDDGQQLAAATEEGQITIWNSSRAYEISPDGSRRSELAWSYYDQAQRSTGDLKKSALQGFLRYAPDEIGFWEARANVLALQGMYPEAADEYSKAMGSSIEYAFDAALMRAYALLAAKNRKDFRSACAELVKGYQDNPVPSNHMRITWLCVLTANQDFDWQQHLDLKKANLLTHDDSGQDHEVLCRGAFWYRKGKYDDAISILSKLIARLKQGTDLTGRYHLACSQYFLAMSLHMKEERSQALALLSEVNQEASNLIDSTVSWRRKVTLDTLRTEAEALLEMTEQKSREHDVTNQL